ncbi:hypothetical protein DITRI_Ditri05aG0068500 [Diplodiscus trichospermus]
MLNAAWLLSREVEVTLMDANLLLLKFATMKDKQRVIDGELWSSCKHLIAFKESDGSHFLYGGVKDQTMNLGQMNTAKGGREQRQLAWDCVTKTAGESGSRIVLQYIVNRGRLLV